jgi:hypothetical protein
VVLDPLPIPIEGLKQESAGTQGALPYVRAREYTQLMWLKQ